VWRLFPGEGYQFLQSFQDQRIGFLDFPGLELPRGDLAQAPDLVPRIARSQEIAKRLSEVPDTDMAFNLEDFAAARATAHRTRLRGALIGFYQEARQGDYVVLPEPVYMSRVWVGQFTTNTVVNGHYYRRYGRTPIPARAIDWLANFPENMISTALSQSLRHQHPFTLLERSLFVETFSLVHGSFVYGDRHVSTIYNDRSDFLDSDAALLGAISRLSAAASRSVDLGLPDLAVVDLIDILLRSPPIEYTCAQESDIHSAGFNRYISAAITPLVIAAVVSAVLGLSQSSSREALATDVQQLQIMNNAPNADPQCTARVSEASQRVLRMLGMDRTWALCEAARAANDRAGIRSSAPVILPPRPAQH